MDLELTFQSERVRAAVALIMMKNKKMSAAHLIHGNMS